MSAADRLSEEQELTKDGYLANFCEDQRKEALKFAHDIRKFEIDLYWKRATYFWTFIAVAFAGFFASSTQSDLSNSYVISCLGLVFSLAWYLVNRGSSAWQRNWEVHVDLLEDASTGPLHKMIVSRGPFRFFDLLGPYSYSPSRINALLSLLLVAVWMMLAARTVIRISTSGGGLTTVLVSGILTAVTAIVMLTKGGSGRSRDIGKIVSVLRRYD